MATANSRNSTPPYACFCRSSRQSLRAARTLDSKYSGLKDARIEVYRHNQDKVPEITGQVIPEQAYSYDEYNRQIFDKVKKAIAPHDPEHLLNHFFLNSRGAIARFDRGAIEIRLVDIQECPNADIAIAEMEIATLKAIANGKLLTAAQAAKSRNAESAQSSYAARDACGAKTVPTQIPTTMKEYRKFLQNFDTTKLAEILARTAKDAEDAIIDWPEFLAVFGMDFADGTNGADGRGGVKAGDIWKLIYSVVKNDLTEVSQSVMEKMLVRGTLATALYKSLGDSPAHESFVTEYKKLADCLAHNRLYGE